MRPRALSVNRCHCTYAISRSHIEKRPTTQNPRSIRIVYDAHRMSRYFCKASLQKKKKKKLLPIPQPQFLLQEISLEELAGFSATTRMEFLTIIFRHVQKAGEKRNSISAKMRADQKKSKSQSLASWSEKKEKKKKPQW